MHLRHLLPAALLLSIVPFMSAQVPSNDTNTVAVRLIGVDGQPSAVVQSPRVVKTDAEWEKQLGPSVYRILRAKGTEAPFCGNLLDNHKIGRAHV